MNETNENNYGAVREFSCSGEIRSESTPEMWRDIWLELRKEVTPDAEHEKLYKLCMDILIQEAEMKLNPIVWTSSVSE